MKLPKQQYDSIMQDYESRRLFHRRQQEERRREVYEAIPEYKRLEHRSADLALERARLLLYPESGSSLTEDFSSLAERKATLLKQAGYPEDYLDMQYDCSACKDTGYVGNNKCHCLKNALIGVMYQQSRIQEILSQENFAIYTDQYYNDAEKGEMARLHDMACDYATTFREHCRSLLFFGDVGCGKTFLTNCIAKAVLDQGCSVLYFTSFQLFHMLSQKTFSSGSEKSGLSSFYDDLFECDLLILDDLGTEGANSFTSSQLFLVMNERLLRNRSTIISTNLSMQQLKDLYSERSVSRIIGGYELYNFRGGDIRRRKKQSMLEGRK